MNIPLSFNRLRAVAVGLTVLQLVGTDEIAGKTIVYLFIYSQASTQGPAPRDFAGECAHSPFFYAQNPPQKRRKRAISLFQGENARILPLKMQSPTLRSCFFLHSPISAAFSPCNLPAISRPFPGSACILPFLNLAIKFHSKSLFTRKSFPK